MAYNRKNLLLKILEVQAIALEHQAEGMYQTEIFKKYIQPRFNISNATYYNYLATNARKELKELEAKHKAAKLQQSATAQNSPAPE
ncbi:MAG: hypothetical protein PHD06_11740 [Bacteroidales bacterium]|nr:hypothetical protein [Bacteroidales bacterium]